MPRLTYFVPLLCLMAVAALAQDNELASPAASPAACVAALARSGEREYGPEYALPERLQVLSWNIYKAQRDNLLPELMRYSEQVDMLLLQEALRDTRLTQLKPYWRFSPGYVDGDMPTGVMVLSQWPAAVHCQLTHTEPWLRTPKATGVVEYTLDNGERLLVVNLHSINFELGVSRYGEQLEAAAAIMRHHGGPIVLAGDLNSWSDDRRELLNTYFAPMGLVPAAFEQDNRTQTFGMPLDHIWTRGVVIGAAEVPLTDSSDHNPLRVTLDFSSGSGELAAGF